MKPERPAPIPAFTSRARVLFQGDSITDGNRGRSADPNHILGHGYVFLIAARWGAAYPEKDVTFLNRGVSGNAVGDLEKRWQTDTLDLKPDLLSVLIGVNDQFHGKPLESYEPDYDALLTAARAASPALKLVLMEPFGLPTGRLQSQWESWSAELRERQAIVARLAKKFDAALAPCQRAFDDAVRCAHAERWIWDGIHPTFMGHQVLAETWVEAVRTRWKKA